MWLVVVGSSANLSTWPYAMALCMATGYEIPSNSVCVYGGMTLLVQPLFHVCLVLQSLKALRRASYPSNDCLVVYVGIIW